MKVAADFAFIPFGGGARKCVGDQFALLEATVAIVMLLRFALILIRLLLCPPECSIHTELLSILCHNWKQMTVN